MPSLGTESSPTYRALLDAPPHLMTELDTGHDELLYENSSVSEEEIWTCRDKKNLTLYNLKGGLLKSLTTKSGNNPEDIAVTRNRNLVYTDYWDRSINLIVRYSGSTEKQSIQLADRNMPLYACSGIKYLSENRNLDICVASSSGG
uniref:Uncharacterized protein LOC111105117 n=1 Tax=Crassostrea virginica TaxID=6565 RepID=A0A8B8AWC4_CRAVI|nr:uncharacterized protein LOC111105117 [Crassostrea virginica]